MAKTNGREWMMVRILDADERGGRDVEYLETQIPQTMSEDSLEDHLEVTRINHNLGPREWVDEFKLILRIIKTARLKEDKDANTRRETTKKGETPRDNSTRKTRTMGTPKQRRETKGRD